MPPERDPYYTGSASTPKSLFVYPVSKHYIERVIFNAPATIVYWKDGTKTVVKCRECSCNCEACRSRDGSCTCISSSDLWKTKGLTNAALKHTFPNYLSEFGKALGWER